MTATRNIPNWNNSDHVTIPSYIKVRLPLAIVLFDSLRDAPPPFYVSGGKKKLITPEKVQGEPPAGVLVAPLTA